VPVFATQKPWWDEQRVTRSDLRRLFRVHVRAWRMQVENAFPLKEVPDLLTRGMVDLNRALTQPAGSLGEAQRLRALRLIDQMADRNTIRRNRVRCWRSMGLLPTRPPVCLFSCFAGHGSRSGTQCSCT